MTVIQYTFITIYTVYPVKNGETFRKCAKSYLTNGGNYHICICILLDPIPSVSDGIVDRQVCRIGANDSCEETMTIKVKNCQTFRVYYLIPTNGCPKAYCFGKNCNCSVFKVLPACTIILYTSMHQI